MRITLAAIGKQKPSPEKTLVDKYQTQLSWPLSILEFEAKKNLPADKRQHIEAQWLLESTAACHRRIMLDERGNALDSDAFAARLQGWQNTGCSHLGLIIGGADGLLDSVRDGADLVLSFGALTWPHMLVRAMAAEQLYRAESILKGHPYHRA